MSQGWRRRVGVLVLVGLGVGSSGIVAAQVPPASEAGCVTGASGIGDGYYPTMGNGGYDVRHYDLDLQIDVATSEILAATTTIEALAVADLCAFNLDFEGLDIAGITVDGGRADFERRGKELTITPAEAIGSGDGFVVEVRYSGTPVIQAGLGDGDGRTPSATPTATDGLGGGDPDETSVFSGGWFVAEDEIFILGEPTGNRYWYPLNEHPADKATYTQRYTVPEPFVVVANGSPAEPVDNGETTTYVFDSRDPMATYLVTFHAGLLDVEVLEGPGGLPIRLSFAPDVPEAQRAVYRRTPEIIAWGERIFGPYPFESAGATVAGVEFYLALETQTIPIFGTFGTDTGSGLAPEELDRLVGEAIEGVLVHEHAHQWFGNAVSVQRWRDIWLNEGFATYAEALWLEETQGEEARDDMLRGHYAGLLDDSRLIDPAQIRTLTAADVLDALRQRGEFRGAAGVERFLSLLDARDRDALDDIPASEALAAVAGSGIPVEEFPGVPILVGDPGRASIFSSATYNRGGLTLHALRLEVGDAAFFEILKEWSERFGGGNAGTADLVALSEEISGQELSPLFDAWLFEVPLPELDGIS